MSSLFSSSDSSSDYTTEPVAAPDYSAMLGGMSEMMAGTMQQMAAMQADSMNSMVMMMNQAPEVTALPEIDWEAKDAELRKKIAADDAAANARKRGRSATILTSALDDSDTKTTDSILTGHI